MTASWIRPLFAAALLMTGACAPLPAYYKPGAAVARLEADTLACDARALKEAPVANEIRQRPPIFYPGHRYCRGGECYYRPGYWAGGGIYTVDANRQLRQRLARSCMQAKGYEQILLKRCTGADTSAAASEATLPAQLDETFCARRSRDGTVSIRSRI